MVTGIRGLCTGLGPALFGIIFYMFGVELEVVDLSRPHGSVNEINGTQPVDSTTEVSCYSLTWECYW